MSKLACISRKRRIARFLAQSVVNDEIFPSYLCGKGWPSSLNWKMRWRRGFEIKPGGRKLSSLERQDIFHAIWLYQNSERSILHKSLLQFWIMIFSPYFTFRCFSFCLWIDVHLPVSERVLIKCVYTDLYSILAETFNLKCKNYRTHMQVHISINFDITQP